MRHAVTLSELVISVLPRCHPTAICSHIGSFFSSPRYSNGCAAHGRAGFPALTWRDRARIPLLSMRSRIVAAKKKPVKPPIRASLDAGTHDLQAAIHREAVALEIRGMTLSEETVYTAFAMGLAGGEPALQAIPSVDPTPVVLPASGGSSPTLLLALTGEAVHLRLQGRRGGRRSPEAASRSVQPRRHRSGSHPGCGATSQTTSRLPLPRQYQQQRRSTGLRHPLCPSPVRQPAARSLDPPHRPPPRKMSGPSRPLDLSPHLHLDKNEAHPERRAPPHIRRLPESKPRSQRSQPNAYARPETHARALSTARRTVSR